MARMAQIHVEPQHSLMDDKIKIQISGLKPQQHVTVATLLDEIKLQYVSYGHYKANEEGLVDLAKEASVGGTYTGLEPEGLLWSLIPAAGQKKGIRLMKKDVTEPHTFQMSVLANHIEANSEVHHTGGHGILAQTSITRSYMAPWVERIPVRHGSVRGILFCPKGKAQYPGVIDLYGTAGGLVEYRASLLASRGFATLALAYFAYDDLPGELSEINLDYFEEAVDWLSHHPRVIPGGVGMVGISKGAELSVMMATLCPKVHAVVSIAGNVANTLCTSFYRGREIPAAMPNLDKIIISERGTGMRKTWVHENVPAESKIEIHKAENAHFLFIHGSHDMNTDSVHSLKFVKELQDHNKDNYECHIYNGAGHLLEVPNMPFSYATYHRAYDSHFLWGGELVSHAKAQQDMWVKMQAFFRRHLQQGRPGSKL